MLYAVIALVLVFTAALIARAFLRGARIGEDRVQIQPEWLSRHED